MNLKGGILSGNQLKLIALLAMTCDHVGKMLFPDIIILRIIGRLAYPIFAYMLAEGCRYTGNRKKHILTLAVFAVICQSVNIVIMRSLYQSIMVTFLISTALIYLTDNAIKKDNAQSSFFVLCALVLVFVITQIMPFFINGFAVDYDFWGVIMPVFIYFAQGRRIKLATAAASTVVLSAAIGGVQFYSLAALPLLALYNGARGKWRIKSFFYIYYPAHLAVIYMISLII